MTKSRNILAPRRPWSETDLALLRANYADSRTDDLALALGRTITTVYQKAIKMGLRKSAAYLASDNACRIQRGRQNEAMKANQFKKGQPSWSKGTKGRVGVQEACRATQFQKGRPASEARNYVPIGTHRVSKDGYLERKVTDDPAIVPARRWIAVHRLLWIEANGPIPDQHVIAFRPGQHTSDLDQITLDRLELVSRSDLARRNSPHLNWPPKLARLVQLRGAITRQINRRAKEAETA